MPTTSSSFSPTTGIREKPQRRASDSAWRSGLAALDEDHVGARHHDLAHEGVAELEDRVDHLAARRPRSRCARSARSTSSRSSASEANGPSRKPRPGRERVAEQRSAAAAAGRAAGRPGTSTPARGQRDRARRAGGRGCAARPRRARTNHGHTRGRDEERPPAGAEPVPTQRSVDQHRRRQLAAHPDAAAARSGSARGSATIGREPRRAPAARPASSSAARARHPRAAPLGARRTARPATTSTTRRRPARHRAAPGSSGACAHRRSGRLRSARQASQQLAPAARTSRAPPPARRGRSRAGAGCRAWSAAPARPRVRARPPRACSAATCGHSTMSPSSAGPARVVGVGRRGRAGRRPQLVHREGQHVGRARARPSTARAARPSRPRRRAGRDSSASGWMPHPRRARSGPARPAPARRPRRPDSLLPRCSCAARCVRCRRLVGRCAVGPAALPLHRPRCGASYRP